MAFEVGGLLLIIILLLPASSLSSASAVHGRKNHTDELHRSSFPDGFIFGTASSAYQYEGAAAVGGRGPSIWDTFTHQHPEKIADRSNGDVAIDSYHRYKEDVKIMKGMNMDAYRLSISWTRILPNGTLGGGINKEGIQYYNNLINELISNGIVPFVTLFHWDSPQSLEDKYRGFLSHHIVKDFKNYANICFKEFGDRVKQWITFNEPLTYCAQGYAFGAFAPGRCSPWENAKCSAGDAGREPYAACHNQLLAHALVVKLYRYKYQQQQKGQIGLTLNTNWFLPYSKSKADDEAVERALDFNYGWFLEPLTRGKYPSSMQSLVGNRLPVFSKKQSKLVKGSYDFIGVNYYTASYTYNVPPPNNVNASFSTDAQINATAIRNGIPIGPQAASGWLYIYPPGIRQLLLYTKSKYNNPVIYITENGVDEYNNKTASLTEALNDRSRVSYYKKHLLYVRQAIRDGVDVRGYFAWSLLDNFEWVDGYSVRFGINYVYFNNGLKRYPKRSAHWFKRLLRK